MFKTDPLQNVDVNSTFDSIAVIQKYIQKQIEDQLHNMFREDLPAIIHRLSQRWLAAQTEKKVNVKTDYPINQPVHIPVTEDTLKALNQAYGSDTLIQDLNTLPPPLPHSVTASPHSQPSLIRHSSTDGGSRSRPPSSPPDSVFPELENYDPSYGLRSELDVSASSYDSSGVHRPSFSGQGSIRAYDDTRESEHSFTPDSSWDELASTIDTEADHQPDSETLSVVYDTYPAVGGGTITKPRIVRPSLSSIAPSSRAPLIKKTLSASSRQTSFLGSPQWSPISPILDFQPTQPHFLRSHPHLYRSSQLSSYSSKRLATQSVASSNIATSSARRPSFSIEPSISNTFSIRNPFDDSNDSVDFDDPHEKDLSTTRPTLSNTNISYLSSLSRSYHTLSPFTTSVEHFMVRSNLPSETNPIPVDKPPVKARRRRIYRVGGSSISKSLQEDLDRRSISPPPPSDCGSSDVDHYFRSPSSERS